MKPNIAKIVGLPVIVIYRESRLSWRVVTEKAESEQNPKDHPLFIGTAADIPLVEWRKGIMLPADPLVPRSFDGYAVREHFMSLRTPQDCLAFLNQYGRFSPLRNVDEQVGWTFDTLMKFQEVFGAFAKLPPDRWNEYANSLLLPQKNEASIRAVLGALNWSRSSIEFRANQTKLPTLRGAKYAGVIETNDVISSILTTLQIDHVRGAKFGACASKGCPRFYEITSQHKRKYCSPECAHLETVRRLRKRQKVGLKRSTKSRAVH